MDDTPFVQTDLKARLDSSAAALDGSIAVTGEQVPTYSMRNIPWVAGEAN